MAADINKIQKIHFSTHPNVTVRDIRATGLPHPWLDMPMTRPIDYGDITFEAEYDSRVMHNPYGNNPWGDTSLRREQALKIGADAIYERYGAISIQAARDLIEALMKGELPAQIINIECYAFTPAMIAKIFMAALRDHPRFNPSTRDEWMPHVDRAYQEETTFELNKLGAPIVSKALSDILNDMEPPRDRGRKKPDETPANPHEIRLKIQGTMITK